MAGGAMLRAPFIVTTGRRSAASLPPAGRSVSRGVGPHLVDVGRLDGFNLFALLQTLG